MNGSQRSVRSASFTSAGSSAARQGSAALSRRTSRSGEDDAISPTPVIASAAAAHDAAPAGAGGAEERAAFRRGGGGGRSVAAASDAGSVDAASLATERGSEAVLFDLEEGAAAGRLEATPEGGSSAAEPDAEADGGSNEEPAAAGRGSSASSGSSHAQPGPSSKTSSQAHEPGDADSVRDPLRYSEAKSSADCQASLHAAEFSGKHMYVSCQPEAASTGGREPSEPCTPTSGDVGHLPVARNTPERRLSLQSDRGHMTATSSQVCTSDDIPEPSKVG